jgi:hypothetical protein
MSQGRAGHPFVVKSVTVTMDGVTYEGIYYLQGSLVYVRSPLGANATQLGGSTPEALAMLLLRSWYARPSARLVSNPDTRSAGESCFPWLASTKLPLSPSSNRLGIVTGGELELLAAGRRDHRPCLTVRRKSPLPKCVTWVCAGC